MSEIIIRRALRRLPKEEIETVCEVDLAVVKKLAPLPPDQHGTTNLQSNEVGCPVSGALFIRDDAALSCANHSRD